MTGRERLQYLAGVWAKWIGPWDDRDRYHELGKATFEALAHGDELVTLRSRLAAVEAERDAARAGEPRAVEALRRCHEGAARQLAEPRDHNDDQYALTAIATECDAVLAAQGPAIDWMAQQRREAAAEALEKLATDLRQDQWKSALHDVDSLRGILRTRAAAIGAGEVGND